MIKIKLLLLAVISSIFNFCSGQVVINEFSAANYTADTDNYGENVDWIELYNAGSSAVDLSGYHLSDREDEPDKWAIPSGVSISAGGFLRFWCTSRDEVSGTNYHTSFKITQTTGAEQIVFADASGVILDMNSLEQPNQTNHSWGRSPNGSDNWRIFTDATPNASNTTTAKVAYATKPDMEPNSGNYSSAVTVEITSPDASVTIRYTTNGSYPISSSTAYTAPITISGTTKVVRTVAFSSAGDILPSFCSTNTYFIDEEVAVPIISICGEDVDDLLDGDAWGTPPIGSFELFDSEFNLIDEAIGEFNKHGNDSWAYAQRGFDYVVRDQFGYDNDIDHEFFADVTDREDYQRLIVKAAANDNYSFEDGAHVRDAYVHHLSQKGNLHLDERSTFFNLVFLNGEYWGVYDTREKVDDADYTDYYYDQNEYEIDFIKCWGGTWADYGDFDMWDPFVDFMTSEDLTDAANYAYVTDNLDIASLTDYVLLNTQTVTMDWLNWNTAWWRGYDPDGGALKWRYILWDQDATFGHYINYTGIPDESPEADPCDPLTLDGVDPNGHIESLNALLENEDFFNFYVSRYADLINSTFSCDFMINILDSMVAVIDPEMERQADLWGGTYTGWTNNVDELREYIEERCAFIAEGIEDCFDTPAYPISIQIDPPLSANDVQVNTILPTSYPFNATYFGGIPFNLTALPASGFIFDHWEFLNNVPSPSTTTAAINLELIDTDTVVAYFVEALLPSYNFNAEVVPAEAGELTINTFTPSDFPYTTSFLSGTLVTMNASANADYIFDFWELDNHVVNPDPFVTDVDFALTTLENVKAHFKLANAFYDAGTLFGVTMVPTLTNNQITVSYSLTTAQPISLEIFALTGNKVADFSSALQGNQVGQNTITISLKDYKIPAGMYFIALTSGNTTVKERVILQD